MEEENDSKLAWGDFFLPKVHFQQRLVNFHNNLTKIDKTSNFSDHS